MWVLTLIQFYDLITVKESLALFPNLPSWERDQQFQSMLETQRKTAHYKIVHLKLGEIIEVNLTECPGTYVCVQPLPDNHYLIVSGGDTWKVNVEGQRIDQFKVDSA